MRNYIELKGYIARPIMSDNRPDLVRIIITKNVHKTLDLETPDSNNRNKKAIKLSHILNGKVKS